MKQGYISRTSHTQVMKPMDSLLHFFFIVVTLSTSEVKAEIPESTCFESDWETYRLIQGEAFYYEPLEIEDPMYPGDNFTWYKNGPVIENITTDEKHRIHYHGGGLFFFNLTIADAGNYTGKLIKPTGECVKYHVKIEVYDGKNRDILTYGSITNSNDNKMIPCPSPIKYICETFDGNFTWYKDDSLLPGEHEEDLWVKQATKYHEGIYTCICTWTHNDRVYSSSGSRRLVALEKVNHRDVKILSPVDKEQFAEQGCGVKLNCSVFCGTNVKNNCKAEWQIPGKELSQMKGYNQIQKIVMKEPSKETISNAILTIDKVSAQDFQHQFVCVGVGFYTKNNFTLTLKPRESAIPLIVGGVCVVLISVLAALLIKSFAIDIALFFRPLFPLGSHDKDEKLYDAFVVYQTQNLDKATEDKLLSFVAKTLPSVLEDKCGYRLFIQGRDDIPGEDHVELVERCMNQSRRLMVILPPGSASGPELPDKHPAWPSTSAIGGFDWQVGLHQALVQREMSVILIQLGDPGPQGYSHLPLSLQHLIQESAPIRGPSQPRVQECGKSRFWKRVRYLMPVKPAKKCDFSSIL
ncbi:interleukin-1 receptor-like 1 [Cololabis saira]|uniref:interleukin-1 receptor-like 1 n=1 Tax=Cololabis saira TaxID=129043 RepID=UPI002AD28DCC|nr:interleukin-1 receptor-like 1 [Cololabis saira]